MLVLYKFKVYHDGHKAISPALNVWDVSALQFLFPSDRIWSQADAPIGNVYRLSEQDAKRFYGNLVEYFYSRDPNNVEMPQGKFCGSFFVKSDLSKVICKLMNFFQEEFAFRVIDFLPVLKVPATLWGATSLRDMCFRREHELSMGPGFPQIVMSENPEYRHLVFELDIMAGVIPMDSADIYDLERVVERARFRYGEDFDPIAYLRAYVRVVKLINEIEVHDSEADESVFGLQEVWSAQTQALS
jgi:hypothetical protein